MQCDWSKLKKTGFKFHTWQGACNFLSLKIRQWRTLYSRLCRFHLSKIIYLYHHSLSSFFFIFRGMHTNQPIFSLSLFLLIAFIKYAVLLCIVPTTTLPLSHTKINKYNAAFLNSFYVVVPVMMNLLNLATMWTCSVLMHIQSLRFNKFQIFITSCVGIYKWNNW